VQPHSLNSFVQKGFRSFRIAPGCELEIQQLAIRINRTPQVTPFATKTNVGLIDVPIQACTTQMFLGSF
jgi:hypothetical protein